MKKTNNKGFSLVELIIVIAIMAILAGAIAPALIRYIDKSRKSNDVSSAKTIKTAIETAMSNEVTYELLTTGTDQTAVTDADGNGITPTATITITSNTAPAAGVSITVTGITDTSITGGQTDAEAEIGKNIGEKTPKIAYKKAADGGTAKPDNFVAYTSKGGSVVVGIKTSASFYQLAPSVSKYYQ